MALYNKESSDEEDDQYATTNVMLGYASMEPTGDTFSHLGGNPAWPDNDPPSASLAKCMTCNSMMALILQLNGDLPEYLPDHERKLYVFTCRNKPCRRKQGAIKAIRATKNRTSSIRCLSHNHQIPEQNEPSKPSQPVPLVGDSIFKSRNLGQPITNPNPFSTSKPTTNANPFSTSSKAANCNTHCQQKHPIKPLPTVSAHKEAPLHETFAQRARISSPPPSSPSSRLRSPWPSPTLLPQTYPSYHLDADYETLDAPSPKNGPSSLKYNVTSSSSDVRDPPATDENDDPANWLSGPAKADKTFLRFAARLAQNPEQVLRYEWCGQPLLYSKDDEVGKAFPSASSSTAASSQRMSQNQIPGCANCGSRRVFEFQLTPHAISELEREEEGLEGMDWGTIVVGSCEQDCVERGVEAGKVGWVEEWVGVSWEESIKGGR
ncbi:MAG: hypothetical protein Q9213_001353 [Squamulea squamosa]